ncbi:MAG: DUF6134 family protein [Pseudomonadota bacterium]
MQRRAFLSLGLGSMAFAAPFATPLTARADEGAKTVFRILRGDKDIGRHSLTARRDGNRFEMDIDIDIRVKFLGITAYRYAMTNREVWEGGQIISVDSTTDDDGTDEQVVMRRDGDALTVEGSAFSGRAPVTAVTTTYYTPTFIDRRPWLSSQSGKRIDFKVDRVAGEGVPGTTAAFQLSGQINSRLIYSAAGEWIGCEFDAQGEPGRYEMLEEGNIAALWRAAA